MSHFTTGKTFKISSATTPVFIVEAESRYVGWRAFARNDMTGGYTEIFAVTGRNGCEHIGTHETRAEAIEAANWGCRHLRRIQKLAA